MSETTETTKYVLVRVGRSGKEIHAKKCELSEGRRGFYCSRTTCGQQRSVRSGLNLIADNATIEQMKARVTCEKCRKVLGFE